jgi:membrane fusion protein, multidrug efflux system
VHGGMALALAACGREQKAAPPPPVVTVADVAERDVPIYVEFAGTLDANVNAEARARVAGILLAQNYREGSAVKAGQLLFTIDPAPFQAALLQARGALEQSEAALEKAEADIERYRPLVAKKAATKEQLDNAIAARHSGEGQVAAAKGALQQAELNLGYTRVLSPVDGIADIAQVRVGNLVGQGTPTLLTTVSSVDPIRFVFQISEARYLEYADRIKQLSERSLAQAPTSNDSTTRLELVLAAERRYPHLGYIAIVGRSADPSTGTLTGQAFFPNPDMLLRPGQYGRARFLNMIPHALVVPQRAVRELQGEKQVAVTGPDNHVDVRSVKVGPVTGGFIVVEQGLKAGERVVVEGVQKVKTGQAVTVTPADTSSLQLTGAPLEVSPADASTPK